MQAVLYCASWCFVGQLICITSTLSYLRCWTQGKPDKLIYLRKALMWYLTETCSPLEALVAANDRVADSTDGPVYTYINENAGLSATDQWNRLGEMCCTAMKGAV
jgi:hypothetical protein